jgi:hypothetical protein
LPHGPASEIDDWPPVWDLIQDKGAAWAEQYKRSGPGSNLWELPKPASAVELLASAIFAFNCEVTSNSIDQRKHPRGLQFHEYYYESEGQVYLLYRFMQHLNNIVARTRPTSIHKPRDRGSWSYRVNRAANGFMEGEKFWHIVYQNRANCFRHTLEPPRFTGRVFAAQSDAEHTANIQQDCYLRFLWASQPANLQERHKDHSPMDRLPN